jgi:predicted N-acyltransferase
VPGQELGAEQARLAHEFYAATVQSHGWGPLQLTPDFFVRVFRELPDAVELVQASRGERVIAGAFNVVSPERL